MEPLKKSDWNRVVSDVGEDLNQAAVAAICGGVAIGILLGLSVVAISVIVAVKKHDAWSYWVPERHWTNAYGQEIVRRAYLNEDTSYLVGLLGSIIGGPVVGVVGGFSACGLLLIPLLTLDFGIASEALKRGQGDGVDLETVKKVFKAVGRRGLVYGMRMTQEEHDVAKEVLGSKVYDKEMQTCVHHWTPRYDDRLEFLDYYCGLCKDVRALIRERIASFSSEQASALSRDLETLERAILLAEDISDEISFLELYEFVKKTVEHYDLPQLGGIFDRILAKKFMTYIQSQDFHPDDPLTKKQLDRMRQQALSWGALALEDVLHLAQSPQLLKLLRSKEEEFLPLFQNNKSQWLRRSMCDVEFARLWRAVLQAKASDEMPDVQSVLTLLDVIEASSETFAQSLWLQDLVLCGDKDRFSGLMETHRDAFFILSASHPTLCKAVLNFQKNYISQNYLERFHKYIDLMHKVQREQTTIRLAEVYRLFGDQENNNWMPLPQQSVRNLVDLIAIAATAPHRIPLGAILDKLLVEQHIANGAHVTPENFVRFQEVSVLPHAGCVKFAKRVANVNPADVVAIEAKEEPKTDVPTLSEQIDIQMMKRQSKLTPKELAAVFGYQLLEGGERINLSSIGCPKTAQALLEDAVKGVDFSNVWTDSRCFNALTATQLKRVWAFVEKYHDWRTRMQLIKFLRRTPNRECLLALRKEYGGKLPEDLYRILRTNSAFRHNA